MKYFSGPQIEDALRALQPFNAFFGVTFLVLKKAGVPVGSKKPLRLDAENERFLHTHYRVHPKSSYFFRVFRPSDKSKDWLRPRYASTSLQSVNTRTFRDALLHEKSGNTWGWTSDYLVHLARRLPHTSVRIPLFQLAVWIYKGRLLKEGYNRPDVVETFVREFQITDDELDALFQADIDSAITEGQAFQELPVRWYEMAPRSTPDDVPAEASGTLNYLEVDSIGPVRPLIFQPSKRLNLITGDNGLGKTFLLDLSWWALTGNWAERAATPTDASPSNPPFIKFAVGAESRAIRADHRADTGTCDREAAMSGLAVYAMLDHRSLGSGNRSGGAEGSTQRPSQVHS